jgi:DNA repair protein RecO (recombination protein O)
MSPEKARTYHAQAVVLKHIEYGEADRILTLFSLEQGKLSAIAKGVRKMKSQKAGHLMPFTQVALFLAKGRNLDVVSQAQAMQTFEGIRADLKRTALAAYAVELVDRFTYEEGEHRQLYKLLVDTLARLDQETYPETAVHYYEIHLMNALGFKPELQRCVSCARELQPEDQFFSARLGGALCPSCRSVDPSAWPISTDVLRYLRFFQRSPWAKVRGREIPAGVERQLRALMERYLTYLLEYGLKTPPFLDAVTK